MTAYVTAAAGNWSTTTNWTPNGTPGNGDTITINHNIAVDSSRTIGTSGATGTLGVTIATGKTLTVNAGVTLTLRCRVDVNGTGSLIMSAGSIIELDSSVAASPSTTKYEIRVGESGHNSGATMVINGSVGSRCTVRSNAGGGNGWINDGSVAWLGGGQVTATYCDFQRLGDSTNPAIRTSPTSSYAFSLQDCTFDANCGRIGGTYNLGATCTYSMVRVNHLGSVDSGGLSMKIENGGSYTSGTRLIDQCFFNQGVSFYTPVGITVTNSVFYLGWDCTAADFVSFTGNLTRLTSTSLAPGTQGTFTDCYWWADDAAWSPHYLQLNSTATVTGNIFELSGSDDNGDCILIGTPGSAAAFTITNNIVLKNTSTGGSGTLFSALGNANCTLTVDHNTYFTGAQGAAVGETYAGHSNMLSSFRSNLAWNDIGSTGFKLYDSGTNDAVTNLVTANHCDYNGGYNLATGSNLQGYNNLEISPGSAGAHDISANPTFVDSARRTSKFDLYNGGAGTLANFRTEIAKLGTPNFNSAYAVASLVTYVKNGFKTQSTSYKDAGHDGVTIGAMGYQSSANSNAYHLLGFRVG